MSKKCKRCLKLDSWLMEIERLERELEEDVGRFSGLCGPDVWGDLQAHQEEIEDQQRMFEEFGEENPCDCLPDCPICGAAGHTVHHADSGEGEDGRIIYQCMNCGRIGYQWT
jgi:hypothetical protein